MARWCDPEDVVRQGPCASYDGDPGDLLPLIDAASEVLFVRSGRQFGTRSVTVRPWLECHRSWGAARHSGGHSPAAPPFTYSPDRRHLTLGIGPLVDVTLVQVDGVTLTEGTDWEVQEATWLVRLPDGTTARSWPSSQRLDLPATEDGTFAVTALVGTPVPQSGVSAAAELACKLSTFFDPCADPGNTTAKNRQGTSYELVSFAEALVNGSVGGLPQVDLFLGTFNPNRLPAPPRVLWPKVVHTRRVDTNQAS